MLTTPTPSFPNYDHSLKVAHIEASFNMSVGNQGNGGMPLDPFTSPEVRRVLETIFYAVFTGVISFLGAVLNVVNIIIFFKQGFWDSVHISLCVLAFTDLGSLLPLVWKGICFNPLLQKSDLQVEAIRVHYQTAGWPHGIFTVITCLITAFITFERCVCITLPMNVKTIITSKRTCILFTVIYLFILGVVSPMSLYSSVTIVRNETGEGFPYSSESQIMGSVSFYVRTSTQLTSFIIVTVCTIILIHNLHARSEWRKKTTASYVATTTSTGSRNRRVVKMVTIVSCIFIICFLPEAVCVAMMIHFSREFSPYGRYRNTYHVTWSVLNTLDAVNGTSGIFVYYNMNSRYRTAFNRLFLNTLSDDED